MTLSERPNITLREIALYLGVTESNIAKSIAALVKANLIVRTKVKNRNMYRLNLEGVSGHPDIIRFGASISTVFKEQPETTSDSTQSGDSDTA